MPFLPLYDGHPLKVIPFQLVTVAIIALCVLTFLWQSGGSAVEQQRLTVGLGAIPAVVYGLTEMPSQYVLIPSQLTLVTSLFLHGGWLHLVSNMLYLWVFGDNVEDEMGHLRFLLFYVLCGIAGGLVHVVLNAESQSPLIGASGAISGVLAAYLIYHPRVRILVLAFYRLPIRLPAYIVLGGWIVLQLFYAFQGGDSNTAWWAHIGGFLAGLALAIPFRRQSAAPAETS